MHPHDLERLVSLKAAEDAAYRRALLSDPAGTLRRFHGVEVPEGLSLRVVEERPGERVLRIPPLSVPEPQEIDLDEVDDAGGFYASGCLANTCSATCHNCVEIDGESEVVAA